MTRLIPALLFVTVGLNTSLRAQSALPPADSGRIDVHVKESMGMLSGFLVQAAGRSAVTDTTGTARLTLPVGRHVLGITRTGFAVIRASAVIVRDSLTTVTVTAEMGAAAAATDMSDMAMEVEAVKVSATRTERLAGETPIRVEVVDEMAVDEKTLMAPSGIGMLLNETPGLRVQPAAPGLGTGSVRILGLPGQYTVMLADGLPLYGASASALGPLDISPVDLQRVEVIKGAASALYGGQALGGVINLVSKAPSGKNELLLNRRTMGVADAATGLSHRFSPGVGASFLASGTTQTAQDVDSDGWADQAKATRWNIRPRLHAVDKRGRSLFVTAGAGLDDRSGGALGASRAPDGTTFREGLRSTRADAGATSRLPMATGSLSMRVAVANTDRERIFGAGAREDDRASTGFAEVTRSLESGDRVLVLGGVVQLDDYSNQLNNRFDHRWVIPGAFATLERGVGPLTMSASARVDAHPDAGTQATGRFALLAKPAAG